MSATVVILLCALACPVSMALMMVFMRKGHGSSQSTPPRDEEKVGDADTG
jgi:hypothetical protein